MAQTTDGRAFQDKGRGNVVNLGDVIIINEVEYFPANKTTIIRAEGKQINAYKVPEIVVMFESPVEWLEKKAVYIETSLNYVNEKYKERGAFKLEEVQLNEISDISTNAILNISKHIE